MNGINVIGFVSAQFGLGVAARNTVRLLSGKGIPVAVADLPLDQERSRQDHSCDHLTIPPDGRLPYDVNFFHLNPPLIGELLKNRPCWLPVDNCLNVAVPFWELPLLPAFWESDLKAMDAVFCPSHFLEQTIAAALPGPLPLVRHYPQTAFLPERQKPGRARSGLPETGVLFVMSFELASDCDRKNPWAAIEAFGAAFRGGEEAYLIVKLNTAHRSTATEQALSRLRGLAAADRRIIIRDEIVPYGEVLALYESCDVYVSLHRSEGLGLGPLEAMLLGKPVIATGWSGNMDFMDETNSCLVGYRLVPVASPLYCALLGTAGQTVWADPDIADAAVWMRRLFDNEELRRTIGKSAQDAMLVRHALCARGEVFDMVEEIYERKKTSGLPRIGRAPGDGADLIARVTGLVERNRLAEAIALYDSGRGSCSATPLLKQFDGLMRQLREKAGIASR